MAPSKKPKVKKVEESNRRNVTFSKRKAGLFNKLTELSILCQAETALIVASPKDKLYACGYPSADAVVRRFLTRGPPAGGNMNQLQNEEKLETLRAQYDGVQEQLKEKKKNLHEIMEEKKRNPRVFCSWWEASVDEMDLDGVEQFKKSLENFRLNVVMRYNTTATTQPLSVVVASPPPPPPPANFQVLKNGNNYYIESGSTSTDNSTVIVVPPPPLAFAVSDNFHGRQEVENGNCIEYESGSTSSDSVTTLPPFPPSLDSSTSGSVMLTPPGFRQIY